MLIYSVIMFAAAILFLALSVMIYRGRTDLIHSYHQSKVTDPDAYGKAFGKALSVIGAAMTVSGIISLAGETGLTASLAVAVLILGLGIGIGCIVAVQKKYNQGIF